MKLNFSKTAVIVIDMQKDFYGEGGKSALKGRAVKEMQSLPGKITEFVNQLRTREATIVFTKFIHDESKNPENYLELKGTRNSDGLCVVDTDGVEFDGVHPEQEDLQIDKYSYDAFARTELDRTLRNRGVNTVIICGVRSEVCVSATANSAFGKDYKTIIAKDLIATYDDKPELTKAILESLQYSAHIQSSSEILGLN